MFNDSWKDYFLAEAEMKSTRSKDPSTKTGAIIVRPDKTVCSVGYNGFPKSMPDYTQYYEDREEKYSRIIHCEMNALLHAYEKVEGYTLFTWPLAPCDRCVVHHIQAGILLYVFPRCPEELESRWAAKITRSKHYIEQCGKFWMERNEDGSYDYSIGENIFLDEYFTADQFDIIQSYQNKVTHFMRSGNAG